MNYYKIYKDGMIVDVNHLFFRYQTKYGRIVPCQPRDAQLITDSKRTKFYTTNWLLPIEKEIPGVISIEAEEISKEEYLELKAELDLGKPVQPAPLEEAPVEVIREEAKAPERVFTPFEVKALLKNMEERIAKLESQINELTKN